MVGINFEELHFSFVFILSHLTIFKLLVLTAIAGINEAVENEDPAQLIEKLTDENAAMTSVDDSLCNRYLSHLMSVKEEKAQVSELAFVIKQFLVTGMNQVFHQVLKQEGSHDRVQGHPYKLKARASRAVWGKIF